jgi:hypothetical protein
MSFLMTRRELRAATKKDTSTPRRALVAERTAWLRAIQQPVAINRDWSDIVDDDKVPRPSGSRRDDPDQATDSGLDLSRHQAQAPLQVNHPVETPP